MSEREEIAYLVQEKLSQHLSVTSEREIDGTGSASFAVADAILALQQRDEVAAYDLGFAASGEGWNGEHPGDAHKTSHYRARRAIALSHLSEMSRSESSRRSAEKGRREGTAMSEIAVVSDHALIRWLERAHGIDMEGYRKQLLGIIQPAVTMGASSVVADGVQFRIRHNTLTTVLPGGRDSRERAESHENSHYRQSA